jgi:hypothetical protein
MWIGIGARRPRQGAPRRTRRRGQTGACPGGIDDRVTRAFVRSAAHFRRKDQEDKDTIS